MRPVLIALALLAAASPALSQEPDWYTVEAIVFAHRADATSAGERWPADPGHPDETGAADVVASTDPPSLRPFEQLGPRALQMGGAMRTLTQSSRYEALVHFGWMQPALRDRPHAVRVRIENGVILPREPLPEPEPETSAEARDDEWGFEVFDDEPVGEQLDLEPEPEPEPAFIDPWFAAERLRAEFAEPPVPERLTGTLTLVLQRFLHVEADLLYTTAEPLADAPDWHHERESILADLVFERIGVDEARVRLEALNAAPRFQSYRLRERRRVRSGELHYFDHPKFGVVVSVRPVPPEELESRRPPADDE